MSFRGAAYSAKSFLLEIDGSFLDHGIS